MQNIGGGQIQYAPPNQIIGGAMAPLAPPIAPPMPLTAVSQASCQFYLKCPVIRRLFSSRGKFCLWTFHGLVTSALYFLTSKLHHHGNFNISLTCMLTFRSYAVTISLECSAYSGRSRPPMTPVFSVISSFLYMTASDSVMYSDIACVIGVRIIIIIIKTVRTGPD